MLVYRVTVGTGAPQEFPLGPGAPIYVAYEATSPPYTIEILEDAIVLLRMGSWGLDRAIWEHRENPVVDGPRTYRAFAARGVDHPPDGLRLMIAPHAV